MPFARDDFDSNLVSIVELLLLLLMLGEWTKGLLSRQTLADAEGPVGDYD